MVVLHLNKETSQLPIFSEDENLIPAKIFLEKWFAGDLSFTFTTSGSTGTPKEIILSRTFIIESAQRTIDLFNISSSDNLLLALNTSFMGGLMMIARALVAKCALVYISPKSLAKEALIRLPHIKLASFVPAQVNSLFSIENIEVFSNINTVLLGGAPINQQLQLAITNLGSSCSFYHTYGMTETASHVALKNISKAESYYTALENYSFNINESACLEITYAGETSFVLQTNDIVHLISQTSFEWLGRADWVVNSGGIKFSIETAELCIEEFFKLHNLEMSFTSHKVSDSTYGERWTLIIEGEPFNKIIETQLCEYCKQKMGKYIYPKEIKYTKKIVYLSSGKIDRLKTYANTI